MEHLSKFLNDGAPRRSTRTRGFVSIEHVVFGTTLVVIAFAIALGVGAKAPSHSSACPSRADGKTRGMLLGHDELKFLPSPSSSARRSSSTGGRIEFRTGCACACCRRAGCRPRSRGSTGSGGAAGF
jgi:hypothetical protein